MNTRTKAYHTTNSNKKRAKIFLCETSVEKENKVMDIVHEGPVQYAMGITYLDAILKQNNYYVVTKDYTTWSEENCLKEIDREVRTFRPDFVGIAVMSMSRVSAYKAIKLIKDIDKNIKIILGGVHASVMYKQLLENFPIDAICVGESEESLVELLDAMLKKKSLKKIKGIAFNEKEKVIFTGKRKVVMDIDKYPFPSYDIFMHPSITNVRIVTSRGCPNRCSFCCSGSKNIAWQIWRPRSYKRVVDEIEHIKKNYPWVEQIEFTDETSTLNNQRMMDICREIIKRGIKLKFRCQGRVKPISKEMFYWMEKAGFVKVCFGIESGAKKIMETDHKNITKEECIKVFKMLQDFPNIEVVKFLIVGLPGETEETVKETIEFVKELEKLRKMNFFYATPLIVYPGTEVYHLAVAKGAINDDFWLTENPCPLYTAEHPEKWLMRMSNKIVIETMLAQGKRFFLGKLIEKAVTYPGHYIKRLFNITENRELKRID